MSDRRSFFRKAAEAIVRSVVVGGRRRGVSVVRLRRNLREAFAMLLQNRGLFPLPMRPRGVWYAAVRAVTGGGVRALVDPRQQQLPFVITPTKRLRSRPARKAPSR